MNMKNKIIRWIWLVVMLLAAIAFLFMPLFAFAQLDAIGVVGETKTEPDASTSAMLKAMFFQILNRPASLLVTIGLSIIAMMIEIVKWIPSDPVKVILPFCILGGAFSYWLFSSTGGVDPMYPYPHAVLVVNGLICGFVAFIAHLYLVKFMEGRLQKKDNPKP